MLVKSQRFGRTEMILWMWEDLGNGKGDLLLKGKVMNTAGMR